MTCFTVTHRPYILIQKYFMVAVNNWCEPSHFEKAGSQQQQFKYSETPYCNIVICMN